MIILKKEERDNTCTQRKPQHADYFEQFRSILEQLHQGEERKSNAGAKPYDEVMMFKILLLQRLYNDRLSFRRLQHDMELS